MLKDVLKRSPLYEVWVWARLRREYNQWLRSGRSPPAPHLEKQRILLEFARRLELRHLVETGTYMGTMINGVRGQFDRIDSIEVDSYLAQRASKRFARFPNIRIHHGDSARVLPGVLAELKAPALFWLDAHYSGGITSRAGSDTPIEAELAAVLSHPLATKHALLVDDARLFDGTHDYPTLEKVKELFARSGTRHTVGVQDDVIRIVPMR